MRFLYLFILVFALSACQTNAKTVKTINMYNTGGDMVGTAKLSETTGGVNIKLKLEGLNPGFHGIHVHEYPKCEGPDYKSAGNHLNPDGKEHGLMHPEGAHLGDLPNIEADAGGLVEGDLMLAEATLLDGKKSLLKGEGTSLIITEKQDDGVSQPGGDSGERIICGEIAASAEVEEEPSDPTDFNEEQEEA
ncbi:superoxide dismutase family protein [Virgibacillus sp. W0181]|uniref:superoxide dismutase family protein n=1 Tax=Virgibacillus sp. W0181 TaxID=3391581 RepID=UPI003F458FDA